MRVPVSWLREYVDLPADLDVGELARRLTMLGLKLEALESPGADVSGPLFVGRVLDFEEEQHSNGKTIRWCQVDVGEPSARGVVCGARNFSTGDLVVVALPGTMLPGGFRIDARKTYGHVSDGMICSARELGLGDDHTGILVLGSEEAKVGDDAVAVLALRDDVIEFEINPDRSDALSLRGVARDAAIAYDVEFDDPAQRFPAATAGQGYPVAVRDVAGCDLFAALEVTGFDPAAPTPRWLARRVQLAGMRPISLAVDVTNYVMLELGNPIHGYDKQRLHGAITVRRAAAGERLTTLDGVERELDPDDLVIADDRGPIGLAGVMGGEATELSAASTDLVIEAAHFDAPSVARCARRHKLPSEASRRFERGVDPTIAPIAALRTAQLLTRYGGGQVAPVATVVGQPGAREAIEMPADLPERVAGFPITATESRAALEAVGCNVAIATDELLVATPPSWRPDLRDPNDLVEEVLRVVGYDKVPSVLPAAPAGRGFTHRQRQRRAIGTALAAAGYVEAVCYPFMATADCDNLGLAPADDRRRATRIANPLSEAEPLLRTTLLPGLLRAQARNIGRGRSDVALYEIGIVVRPRPGEPTRPPALGVGRAPTAEEYAKLDAALPAQPLHMGVVAAGNRSPAGWWGPAREATWADAVQACRLVADVTRTPLEVESAHVPPWHPGRSAVLRLDGVDIGHAGELHPAVCRSYGVPVRTVAAELDLEALSASAADPLLAPVLANFPVGKEDVALVVDDTIPAAAVEAVLREGAGELLESLRLFDVYVGEQVGTGRRSLAYSLRFRAADRTLTEAEIAAARDAAVALAGERLGARPRG